MKFGTILTLGILTVFLFGIVGLSAEIEIALEAELADEITGPMIIDEDKNASDGKFIWAEGEPATGGWRCRLR